MKCITKYAELERNWFKEVCIEGTYTIVNTSRLPGKPSYGAWAAVRIDRGSVLIGVGKQALRPGEERKTFKGKKVRVIGTLNPDVPWWGDGIKTPTIVGPALSDVKNIAPI